MMTGTYSPEDNKLRLYASTRLDPETFGRVKAAGFKWAPKQDLFFAPAWTPGREDLLIELCGEIADEDTSLVDRAEQRAERFEEYSEKRGAESQAYGQRAGQIANLMDGQPVLVGHHSEKRHRRDIAKMHDAMSKSVRLWQTSEYWTRRAAAAVKAAKYKERPDVRARRIKTIEADKRKAERSKADAERQVKLWSLDNLTIDQARQIANYGHLTVCHTEGKPYGWTAWDVLRPDGERYADCPAWTVEQVKAKALELYAASIAHCDRWIEHYENRLAYERAMLAADGGTVADKDRPEVGGAVRCWASPRGGWSYVQKVNKVSVTVLDNWGRGENFRRTVPFDKLAGVMSAAEVQAAREAGNLFETDNKIGFILR